MALLRSDPSKLALAIATVNIATTIPAEHIEKDYWLTECLRGLQDYAGRHNTTILLKGGTSLSKGHQLIQRFSEDADVLVLFGTASQPDRAARLEGLVLGASKTSGLAATITEPRSATRMHCVAALAYRATRQNSPLSPRVKLELVTVGGTFPHEKLPVRSLLSTYWASMGAHAQTSQYDELRPFTMDVLDPCRTLVEKLVLLHEAHTRHNGGAHDRKVQTLRHYYDVRCLLGDGAVVTALEAAGTEHLSRDVCTYADNAGYRTAARPADGFSRSPTFAVRLPASLQTSFSRVMDTFLWPSADRPTLDECQDRVREHASRL